MNPTRRIAMVAACPFPCPRGTPVRIFRTAEALAGLGHEIHVVTYHLGEETGPLPFQVHRIRPVSAYRKLSPGPTWRKLFQVDPLLAGKLSEVLREHSIDLIHAHHYEGLLVALAARARCRLRTPVIYDAHTLLEAELPSYRMGLPSAVARALGRWLDAALPARADRVIAVTDTIRDTLLRNGAVRPEQITVIPNGVEIERFAGARAREGSPRGEGPRLIFAGNLAHYQRIDLLLRSFRAVLDWRPDARMTIASSSSFAPYEGLAHELAIREAIEPLDSDFERLPAQLEAADVALNPRVRCAGMPQKLLNYMAAGKPIVSFHGSRWILEHGKTGWLAEDHDVTAFAGGVLRLLDDPQLAGDLGRAAHDLVRSRFSWERTAADIEVTYREFGNRSL